MNWRVLTPVWAAAFGGQVSASRPALSWESVWTWRIGAAPPQWKRTSARSWRPREGGHVDRRSPAVESLTPTELRVAQLAAQGISNSGIAEQTFVSRNTVAWHLRNIYRKLALESRDQLLTLIND